MDKSEIFNEQSDPPHFPELKRLWHLEIGKEYVVMEMKKIHNQHGQVILATIRDNVNGEEYQTYLPVSYTNTFTAYELYMMRLHPQQPKLVYNGQREDKTYVLTLQCRSGEK